MEKSQEAQVSTVRRATRAIELDSVEACRKELERVSNDYVTLVQDYTQKRERLGQVEMALADRRAYALIEAKATVIPGTGKPPSDKVAEAQVHVMLAEDGDLEVLVEEEAELTTDVEIMKQRFKALEQRGGHAQSAIRAHEQEARFAGYGS